MVQTWLLSLLAPGMLTEHESPPSHAPPMNYCVLQINDGARAIKREESQGNAS